jgi:RsiG-like
MSTDPDVLARLLTSSYLEGVDQRPLDEIRVMRSECQQAEVELSYLRRLVQGRLDIVHAFLAPEGGSAPDLSALVDNLPVILAGPSRPAGPGHLPMLLTPDTDETELTAELDAILGADEIASLADLDEDALRDVASRLEALEKRVSHDRRALHERIDRLQAELVERHKTGRASVDGLIG